MREEFPSLARLGRPAIAVEPLWWAFVSGLGANPVVGGLVRIVFLWLAPILYPPTVQRPEWLSPNNIVVTVGALATGAVLIRAGGAVALLIYTGYEIVRVFAALPARQLFCKNVPNLPPSITGCDLLALLSERWVTFVALLIGAALGLVWLRARGGENGLLRAAGAFSLVLVVLSTAVGLLFLGRTDQTAQNAMLALFTVTNILGGAAAGVLLARERFAAALLLILLIVSPGLSLTLPLLGQPTNAPFAFRWSGVYVPVLAAIALLAARGYVRRGDGGAFF
jgi:hypothetical protein